jgi:hypothetical protein
MGVVLVREQRGMEVATGGVGKGTEAGREAVTKIADLGNR